MFVGWAKSRRKRKKRAGKGPNHRSQLTTKDNHVKFAIIDGLVLVWDAGMEATSRMQGESQEHLARLPVGCHRLLKWDFIVLVFLGTELQEAKCDFICFTRGCPLTYASHFLNTHALWNKDEMAPKSGEDKSWEWGSQERPWLSCIWKREGTYLMNGQAVAVLISQGHGVVGWVVILISGHYLQSVWLTTGQHKSRKMAHNFGFGRNHHAWNRQRKTMETKREKQFTERSLFSAVDFGSVFIFLVIFNHFLYQTKWEKNLKKTELKAQIQCYNLPGSLCEVSAEARREFCEFKATLL